MTYASEAAQWEEDVAAQATESPQLSSSVKENFIFGVGQTIDKALSISEQIVKSTGGWSINERDEEIREMRRNGEIDDDVYMSFVRETRRSRSPDYDALANYLRSKGKDIRTNQMMDDDMRKTLKERDAIAQDIFSRQTGAGLAAELAGGFAGYALEPAMIAAVPLEAYFIGRSAYTLSQATTRLARAAQIGKTSALTNMAVEASIQPLIYNWREEIGDDMSWGEALINVASAGVMSGVMTAAASGIKSKARFAREQESASITEKINAGKSNELTTPELASILKSVRQSAKNVADDIEADDLLKQAVDELESLPKGTNAKEHFQKLSETEKRINSSTPPAKQAHELTDEVIVDTQIDNDYELVLQEDNFISDLQMKDLEGEDVDNGMFGFSELDSVSKDDVKNAISEIENADAKAKQLETCLLGSEAPF